MQSFEAQLFGEIKFFVISMGITMFPIFLEEMIVTFVLEQKNMISKLDMYRLQVIQSQKMEQHGMQDPLKRKNITKVDIFSLQVIQEN